MKLYKFRGKDRDNMFQYGDLTHEDNLVFVDEIRVDPDSVAQFLGYDKNGKEIYSDDRIRTIEYYEQKEIEVNAEVILVIADIGKKFDNVELVERDLN